MLTRASPNVSDTSRTANSVHAFVPRLYAVAKRCGMNNLSSKRGDRMLQKLRQQSIRCNTWNSNHMQYEKSCNFCKRKNKSTVPSRITKATIAWSVWIAAGAVWAQCGVTQSCPSIPNSILLPIPSTCQGNMCFSSTEKRKKYEHENNCIFPDQSLCDGKEIDSEKQCCVKNAITNKRKIKQKQYTSLDKSFDWNLYKKECVDMQQSEAPPDALWRNCVVGQPHSVDDDYAVMKVERIGNARSYCIDGCSTPPSAVALATNLGYFIFPDRNNPTGGGAGGIGDQSSFLSACSNHDRCYQTCSKSNQEDCDNSMLTEMQSVCRNIPEDHQTIYQGNFGTTRSKNTRDACISAAEDMHTALRKFGASAFNKRRQQYCQCC